jgi:hypothetical protein
MALGSKKINSVALSLSSGRIDIYLEVSVLVHAWTNVPAFFTVIGKGQRPLTD